MSNNDKDEKVKQYLIKYCRQIGIIDVEVPELYLDAEQFHTKLHDSITKRGIELEQDVLDTNYFKGIYGHCGRRYGRFIYVNIDRFNDDDIHNGNLRRLLIHELLHYRFPDMKHGQEFYEMIELIMIGKHFPKVHIPCPDVPFI